MPSLDRRIVVRRTVTARNQFGESVETTTDYSAMGDATKTQASATRRNRAARSRSPAGPM